MFETYIPIPATLEIFTKQASHNWNTVLDDSLGGHGFNQGFDDPGLYYRVNDGSIDVVHVDGPLIAFKDREAKAKWVRDIISRHLAREQSVRLARLLGMDWE